MRHPLQHLRGNAVRALRSQGVHVDVLGEDLNSKIIEVYLHFSNILALSCDKCAI
jgi:hypothetical protein